MTFVLRKPDLNPAKRQPAQPGVTLAASQAQPAPQPDYQEAYGRLLTIDAKITRRRMEYRNRIGDGHKATSPDAVNAALRVKASGLELKKQAKCQCDYCFKLILTSDLISAGGGNRRCSAPACAEKAKRWRAKP